jgi:predicted amidophosphoribosyltransferase
VPSRLLSLVAPPGCGVCGERCASKDPVCGTCRAAILATGSDPFIVPGVDRAWAAAPYEGVPRRLVVALKFGRRLALAGVAAEAIAARAGGEAGGALVPVPADPWRRRARGFDPAAEIARALARRLSLPLSPCLVRHHRRRQVGRARAERLTCDLGVRAIMTPPAAVLLVDDVVTTGATLGACARALRTAGCEEILAVTFARA